MTLNPIPTQPQDPPTPPPPEPAAVVNLQAPAVEPRVIRAPGRLAVEPTDLALPFPHGGVSCGRVRAVVLQPLGGVGFRVMSEGLGEPTDILKPSQRFVFTCFLRGWDDAALAALWPDQTNVGAVSGHAIFEVPGRAVPGESAIEDRARLILFEPDDPVAAPSVLIYRGIPDWRDASQLMFQRTDELGMPLVVECMRGGDGRTISVGRLSDLTL